MSARCCRTHVGDASAVYWTAAMALRRQVLALHLLSMLLCQLPRGLICCTMADLTSSLPLKASTRYRIETMLSCCTGMAQQPLVPGQSSHDQEEKWALACRQEADRPNPTCANRHAVGIGGSCPCLTGALRLCRCSHTYRCPALLLLEHSICMWPKSRRRDGNARVASSAGWGPCITKRDDDVHVVPPSKCSCTVLGSGWGRYTSICPHRPDTKP